MRKLFKKFFNQVNWKAVVLFSILGFLALFTFALWWALITSSTLIPSCK